MHPDMHGESQSAVYWLEALEELQGLVRNLVDGSFSATSACVMDNAGTVLASYPTQDSGIQSIWEPALRMFRQSEHSLAQLGGQRLHQAVLLTSKGYLTIADFGEGVLIVLSKKNKHDLESITPPNA